MRRSYALRNITTVTMAYYFANIAFIMMMYEWIDRSLAFLCVATGLVLFSFFLKRGINQITGT
jgi:hypothetical protein